MDDVIIVGGGPAGLSAALVLGRCRRKVLIFDDDKPRNARSTGVHGFLGHNGMAPARLREVARAELAPYDIDFRHAHVARAARDEQGFEIVDANGKTRTRPQTPLGDLLARSEMATAASRQPSGSRRGAMTSYGSRTAPRRFAPTRARGSRATA
jgi:2-polyprenyl-6-methoxyphenol hydroxylase-like FAD-dependent oxidoreductase